MMLVDEGNHVLLAHGIHAVLQVEVILLAPVLNDLIGAEALLASLAVHERIGKSTHMAGGHPGLGIHQDGSVHTHVIGVLLDELLPPCLLDVVLQLHTQRAVVPGVGQAAIDLTAGKDKAAVLAQIGNLFHGLVDVFHFHFLPTLYSILDYHYSEYPDKNQALY